MSRRVLFLAATTATLLLAILVPVAQAGGKVF
jgi:hypothetical protein